MCKLGSIVRPEGVSRLWKGEMDDFCLELLYGPPSVRSAAEDLHNGALVPTESIQLSGLGTARTYQEASRSLDASIEVAVLRCLNECLIIAKKEILSYGRETVIRALKW